MIKDLETIREAGLGVLGEVKSAEDLEQWRIQYLSRQGKLTLLLGGMKDVPKEDKPATGRVANEVKKAFQEAYDEKKEVFELGGGGDDPYFDATLSGRGNSRGSIHVLNQIQDRMVQIFRRMGYAIADGPDVETEYHNFDALNTPKNHPARNEQDTFYVDAPKHEDEGRYLLRTQTSPVQIRVMKDKEPPIRVIAPGRCYRRDEIDATHGVFFTQTEGLVIDEGISLADLKGTLEFFFQEFLGPETRVRFRPHFFPFTEPSFEVDLSQPGLKIRGKEWVEISGCGMVDPNVLEEAGIDSERYTGFAFGMGIERMAMMIHEIPDLRLLFENDIRFLKQFA